MENYLWRFFFLVWNKFSAIGIFACTEELFDVLRRFVYKKSVIGLSKCVLFILSAIRHCNIFWTRRTISNWIPPLP